MELLSRSAAFVIGVSLVLLFLQSVLRVSVVNRQKGDPLALIVGHVAHTTVAHLASRRRTYDRIQDALAWVLPLYVLLLITVWFVLVQMGFSLMIWSLQAEQSLLRAFIASGSALSTLGFLTPPDLSGQLLAIPEGAFGLGIVVFFFTFIPGYQTTVQTRELRVAWFYARAGPAPTALSFMEWSCPERCNHRLGGLGSVVSIVDRNPYAGAGRGRHTIRSPRTKLVGCRRGSSGYRILVAFVPRRQGPRLGDSVLQHGGERPEIDCRAAWKAAELPCSRTTGRALEIERATKRFVVALSRLELRSRPIRTRRGDASLRCGESTSICCLNWPTSLLVPMDNSVLLPVAD